MGRDGKGSVGFIGIGTMGREMVRNLLKAGHAVRAFDLNEAAVADVAKDGAARAQSMRQTPRATPTSSSPCCPIRPMSRRWSMARTVC